MHIELESDNYEIIAWGQPFLFGRDTDLTIHVTADNHFVFSIVLKFLQDLSGEPKMENTFEADKLILSCINFDDNGRGLVRPVQIAVIDNRKMYFMFWSFMDGEQQVRSIRYTIFYERG